MNNENNTNHNNQQQENDTQRLHRMVLPMILGILRDHRRTPRGHRGNNTWERITSTEDIDTPPPLIDNDEEMASDLPHSSDSSVPVDILADQAQYVNRDADTTPLPEDLMEDVLEAQSPALTQQGQLVPTSGTSTSPPGTSTSPRGTRRPRYRLVVYFEERDSPSTEESSEGATPAQPAAPTNRPSSRYVAVFSIDSDSQNMPIIHSAGLQNTPANFDDLLNQLFTSYMPKGTPPAKKEIIDSLPSSAYTNDFASQPKCAVCLEDFEVGSEMVELPCSHRFHGENCVKPWLRMHSSCPVCRYEMPVDDVEYEQKRKERMAARATSQSVELDDSTNVVNM